MSPGNSTRSETGPRKASHGRVVAKKVVCWKIVNPGGGGTPIITPTGMCPSLGVFFKEKFSYWV